ncbi:oligosaccharide flippase family protein [Desulfobacterales bacterium HSG17]|nr:oligosaccharide flippase family protein [Desulfobacterales bacterium HSG17]
MLILQKYKLISDKYFSSKLKKNSINAFILRVFGYGLLFLMHTMISQSIGTKGFGIFSFTLTLSSIISNFATLGWPSLLLRLTAQYKEEKKWSFFRGSFIRGHQITFIISTIFCSSLWSISYLLNIAEEMAFSFRFAAIFIFFLAFSLIRRKIFFGLQRINASIIPDDIILPMLVIFVVYLFSVSNIKYILTIYSITLILVFLIGSLWLLYCMPVEGRKSSPKFETKKWVIIALPMMMGGLSQMVMNRTDILMLSAMTDMDSVGIYYAGSRIARLNVFVLGTIGMVAAPLFTSAFYGKRINDYKKLLKKTMLWSGLGALPLFLFTMLMPKQLLNLFGMEFTEGALILRILSISMFINATTGPVGFALISSVGERQFGMSLGVTAVFNIIGNYFAIKMYGAVGAAYVTALSVIVLNVWQLVCVVLICSKYEKLYLKLEKGMV